MASKSGNDRMVSKGRGLSVPPSSKEVLKGDEQKLFSFIGRGRGAMLMNIVSGTRRPDSLPAYLFRRQHSVEIQTESAKQSDFTSQTPKVPVVNWATQTYRNDWRGDTGRIVRLATPRAYQEVCEYHKPASGSFWEFHAGVIAPPIRRNTQTRYLTGRLHPWKE